MPRSKLQGVARKRGLAGGKGLAEKQGKTVEEGDRTGAVMKKQVLAETGRWKVEREA